MACSDCKHSKPSRIVQRDLDSAQGCCCWAAEGVPGCLCGGREVVAGKEDRSKLALQPHPLGIIVLLESTDSLFPLRLHKKVHQYLLRDFVEPVCKESATFGPRKKHVACLVLIAATPAMTVSAHPFAFLLHQIAKS